MTIFLLLAGAAVAYFLPLRRRPHFVRRLVLCLAVLLPLLLALMMAEEGTSFFFASSVLGLAWGIGAAYFCVELDLMASCYCSIWLLLTADVVYELWRFLQPWVQLPPFLQVALQLVFFALCFVAVHFTLGRGMPAEGVYHIGPRQLLSAVLLGGMFWFQFLSLQKIWLMPQDWTDQLAIPAVLTQLYCLTLLYLQTELFKKSAMQKEMDALNLLYDRQRQQYQVARQNVQIINRKCHELKVQIADLRRLSPDAATRKSLDEAEQAAKLYNADVQTGNEVLNVALTEKALLCESHDVRLNCVADGRCLAFMEPGDLYALIANVLDPAIEAAARVEDMDRRLIDFLLCARQGFAVLAVTGPEPAGTAGRYELKVMRRILQKYNGTMTHDTQDGRCARKILFPVQEAS